MEPTTSVNKIETEEYLWRNWHHIKQTIDKYLINRGVIQADMLRQVPSEYRLAALDRYAAQNVEADLSYTRETGILQLKPVDRVKTILEIWNNLAKTWDALVYRSEMSLLLRLVKGLSESLGFLPIAHYSYGDRFGFLIETPTLHLNVPGPVPFVFINRDDIDSTTVTHIRDVIQNLERLNRPHPHLFALIVALENADKIRQQLLATPFVRELIVISKENIQKILMAKDPSRVLRSFIIGQVDLLSISPFVITGPTSDRMFFGREAEMREITRRLMSVSYAIIGGRRIGKTSMLGRLHRVRLSAAGFRTLYYDCATTPSYQAFLSAAIRDWQPGPPPNVPATFDDLLQSPPDDKPFVLLLDEADKLVAIDRASGWRLFKTLRALANSGHVQVILSGERTLREAIRDPTGPLFNFTHEMLIGRLDFRAVEELVTTPAKQLEIELVDEKAVVDRIWVFTSGHPNVIQRLCHRLIERLNEQGTRRITLDDINAVIQNPQFQEVDFLQTYWAAATLLEKIITLVLSQEARTYSLKEIRQLLSEQTHIQPSAMATKDALDRLVDLRSILKRSQTGYGFAVEAFPSVLANTITVEDLLEVLVEQYEQAEGQA